MQLNNFSVAKNQCCRTRKVLACGRTSSQDECGLTRGSRRLNDASTDGQTPRKAPMETQFRTSGGNIADVMHTASDVASLCWNPRDATREWIGRCRHRSARREERRVRALATAQPTVCSQPGSPFLSLVRSLALAFVPRSRLLPQQPFEFIRSDVGQRVYALCSSPRNTPLGKRRQTKSSLT